MGAPSATAARLPSPRPYLSFRPKRAEGARSGGISSRAFHLRSHPPSDRALPPARIAPTPPAPTADRLRPPAPPPRAAPPRDPPTPRGAPNAVLWEPTHPRGPAPHREGGGGRSAVPPNPPISLPTSLARNRRAATQRHPAASHTPATWRGRTGGEGRRPPRRADGRPLVEGQSGVADEPTVGGLRMHCHITEGCASMPDRRSTGIPPGATPPDLKRASVLRVALALTSGCHGEGHADGQS